MTLKLTNKIHKQTDRRSFKKYVVTPDIIITSGIPELDHLLGGFKAGELTCIDGNSRLITDLPNRLCVNTYHTFHSDVIYIDGGLCANPYQIARYARMLELNQHTVLQHIHISRAFTVYQLSTLIQDLLEPAIQKHTPQTLIIGMFPALYLDKDIADTEAQILLKTNLKKLKELATTYNVITILTNRDTTITSSQRNLRQTLYRHMDEIVSMKQIDQCIQINLIKQQRHATIVSFARGQLRLEPFGLVM